MEKQSSGAAMVKGEGGEKTRIYVGGLGQNVTEEDLKKTFSLPQLGFVQSVDLIRTKGRGFAYLDFIPTSDHSLLKIFSKYNGCMWKGGRLRLEKAKEHYLLRLERERAEDAEVDAKDSNDSACPPSNALTSSLDKLKKNHALEKLQLNIYFPKLRKIKPLPFKGSGKHKYSFQRVEVPPFPIHFCDCEQHSGSAYYTAKETDMASKSGGVDENELNIMSSVLNKIFERENRSEAPCNKVENSANVAYDSMVSEATNDDNDDVDEEEDDGIIINVIGRKNSGIHQSHDSHDIGKKSDTCAQQFPETKHTHSVKKSLSKENYGDQKIIASKKGKVSQDCEGGAPDDRKRSFHAQKTLSKVMPGEKTIIASRKRKVPHDGEGGLIDKLCALNDGSHSSHPRDDDVVDASHVESSMKADLHSVDLGVDITPPTKKHSKQSEKKELQSESKSNGIHMPCFTDENNQEPISQVSSSRKENEQKTDRSSAKGGSWMQTCSWTQLVGGDTRNSSFSISQILPGLHSEKGPDLSSKLGVGSIVDHLTVAGSSMQCASKERKNDVHVTAKLDNYKQNEANDEEKKGMRTMKQAPQPDIGKMCTFTRNATSMKVWKNAKAALSGPLKKNL
ncbi:unnamed protein product [Cuscuta epithymum]|uniref:RRM domain-containing protein n=1 Tax=Cuscuta epithymum TaxID=186058 RepID=A0AAV0CL83_9ASTE|nr:unnamed protein product [Cuscuta epithymum]